MKVVLRVLVHMRLRQRASFGALGALGRRPVRSGALRVRPSGRLGVGARCARCARDAGRLATCWTIGGPTAVCAARDNPDNPGHFGRVAALVHTPAMREPQHTRWYFVQRRGKRRGSVRGHSQHSDGCCLIQPVYIYGRRTISAPLFGEWLHRPQDGPTRLDRLLCPPESQEGRGRAGWWWWCESARGRANGARAERQGAADRPGAKHQGAEHQGAEHPRASERTSPAAGPRAQHGTRRGGGAGVALA